MECDEVGDGTTLSLEQSTERSDELDTNHQ